MQSEGGAAGAVHGALQAGALTTTFTASQGLLLMIPNMYKIAGELTSFCMHVSARTLATHALSIFGDHSDVMACRQTGFALLCLGLGAGGARLRLHRPGRHAARARPVPALLRRLPHLARGGEDRGALRRRPAPADRRRARRRPPRPRPDAGPARCCAAPRRTPTPSSRRARRATPSTTACPAIVQEAMDGFAELTGRQYHLFDYVGHPEAERVVVLMGSGGETAARDVEWAGRDSGEKVGVLQVRLYRPFAIAAVRRRAAEDRAAIAVLDRTKEPGAVGEPLYLDVVAALREAADAGESAVRPAAAGRSAAATACRRRSSRRRWSRRSSTKLGKAQAQEPLHRRHRRRRDAHLAAGRPRVRHRARRRGAGRVLRPRRRRHRRRQQELDQDHRRGDRQLRPGLLRLRLEEVGRGHDLAPALRARGRSAPRT